MYSCKLLCIPDYVVPNNINTIYHYFDYFNIAKIKNINFYDHPEEEYYVEDVAFYGYIIIEIEKWYENNGSYSFYESLLNNTCKIVYNDPDYWEVELYKRPMPIEIPNSPKVINKKYHTLNVDTENLYLHRKEDIKLFSDTNISPNKDLTTDKVNVNLNTNLDNNNLKRLLIKKNKKFSKNTWTRRLRSKLSKNTI